jgi:hypothetical protein
MLERFPEKWTPVFGKTLYLADSSLAAIVDGRSEIPLQIGTS